MPSADMGQNFATLKIIQKCFLDLGNSKKQFHASPKSLVDQVQGHYVSPTSVVLVVVLAVVLVSDLID